MNHLIPIATAQLDGEATHTCDARDLHVFLEVGKVFAAWIQERIEQYGFMQGRDFEVFSESGKNPRGGRPAKEYAISLDMAKELAMVERNEKGREARRYFIDCERRAKQAAQPGWARSFKSESAYVKTHLLRMNAVTRLYRAKDRAAQEALHAQAAQLSLALGLPEPEMPMPPVTVPYAPPATHVAQREALTALWHAVEMLLAAGHRLNHARTEGLLALNLPQVRQLAEAAGLPLPEAGLYGALRASPQLVEPNKAYNSPLAGRIIKCWVFKA